MQCEIEIQIHPFLCEYPVVPSPLVEKTTLSLSCYLGTLVDKKGNYKQGEKTAFRMGWNNSKWSNWHRINLKNIQPTPAAQFQKYKQPNKKNGPKN